MQGSLTAARIARVGTGLTSGEHLDVAAAFGGQPLGGCQLSDVH